MIGYNCKYAPVELLEAFDEVSLLNNSVDDFDDSSKIMHPNMCSHIKALYESISATNLKKVFLVNCCDSTRRLFDALYINNLKFLKSLDLPTENRECSIDKLKNDLLYLIAELEAFYEVPFNKAKFLSNFKKDEDIFPNNDFIALLGSRSNSNIYNAVVDSFEFPVVDLTCANNRNVKIDSMDVNDSLDELMYKYAKAILNQVPCMRMVDISGRKKLLNNPYCKGIVYHTIKFCDYYDYEYSVLSKGSIPITKIETDFTVSSQGQILTRLEGFSEAIKRDGIVKMDKNMRGKYYIGIDSGSTSTELVAIDEENNIVKTIMVRTGANASLGAQKALKEAKIKDDDIVTVVATGYGRKNIGFAKADITEITCHARGAKFLFPSVRTVIDIGGQDSKVIFLDEKGNITNFNMNDKCAAGTGRFLENMAKVLELNIDELVDLGLKYKNDLTISSMCTVFAESEVVSLIAENKKVEDIIHGLNKSVATKTKTLAYKAVGTEGIMMTGGVAKNRGVVEELKKQLDADIYIPEYPEFCGALGAALIALDGN